MHAPCICLRGASKFLPILVRTLRRFLVSPDGKHFKIAFVVLLYFLFNTTTLRADVTGTILGTIADPSGAAVPGAKVTLSNAGTGFNRQTTTDSTGFYAFLSVPVGEHYVCVDGVSGLRIFTQTGTKPLVY